MKEESVYASRYQPAGCMFEIVSVNLQRPTTVK